MESGSEIKMSDYLFEKDSLALDGGAKLSFTVNVFTFSRPSSLVFESRTGM